MKISAHWKKVLAAVKTGVPELKTVEPLFGPITKDFYKQAAAKLPAVFVTMAGIPKTKPLNSGETEADVYFAFFLFSDRMGKEAPFQATDLAEKILALTVLSTFGSQRLKPAEGVEMEFLFPEDTNKDGVALLAMGWTQKIVIGRKADLLDNLTETEGPPTTLTDVLSIIPGPEETAFPVYPEDLQR